MTHASNPDPPLSDGARDRLELVDDAELSRRLDLMIATPDDMRPRAMREAIDYGWKLQRDRMMPVAGYIRDAEALTARLSAAMRRTLVNSWPVGGEHDHQHLPHQHIHMCAHVATREGLQRRGLVERRHVRAGRNYAYRLTPLGRAVRMVLRRDSRERG